MGADFYKYAGLGVAPATYGVSKMAGASSDTAGKIALGVGTAGLTGGLLGPAVLGLGAGAGTAAAVPAAAAPVAVGTAAAPAAAGTGLSTGQIAMMTAGQALPGLLGPLLERPRISGGGGGSVGGTRGIEIPESLRRTLLKQSRQSYYPSLGRSLLG